QGMELFSLWCVGSLVRKDSPLAVLFPHGFCAALLELLELQLPGCGWALGSYGGQDLWNPMRRAIASRFRDAGLRRHCRSFQRPACRPLILRVFQGFVYAAHIFVPSVSTQAGTDEPLPSSRRVKSLSNESVCEKLAAALAIAPSIAWISDAVSFSGNP